MDNVFCKDKKDFCDGIKDCMKCEHAKGNGVISGYVARDVLAALFGLDYDLDRLRELVKITKEIPHKCQYCIGCEIEPKDGHGCDGDYDNFVFSVRRLRELVEYALVVHGRWEWDTSGLYPKPLCNRCGEEPWRRSNHQSDLPNYCPNCGARMDGTEENG